jgi:hypothetical protein
MNSIAITRPHFFCIRPCLLICVLTLAHFRFRLEISSASVYLDALYFMLLNSLALTMLVAYALARVALYLTRRAAAIAKVESNSNCNICTKVVCILALFTIFTSALL